MPPALADMRRRLAPVSESPDLDASVLIAHLLGRSRAWVLAHPEIVLTTDEHAQLENAVARLERGEPLPYVLGRWEFLGLDFDITPDVLIPRPETELLVETAIDWLAQNPGVRTAADVGTGSGVIAVSLAHRIRDLQVLATDVSAPALGIARGNALKHGVGDRIDFVECDLLPKTRAGGHEFSLICANPPYIPTESLQALPIYGREPTLALDGGPDGLVIIRRLLALASGRLAHGGRILLEIEATQGRRALKIASMCFPNAAIQIHRDLAGHDRLLDILPETE